MWYRPSQTIPYWTNEFKLLEDDKLFLQEHLLEAERPLTSQDLTRALVTSRFQREEQRIRRELSRGVPYQPKDDYEVGQALVFPALDFSVGTVIRKRPGHNPEHGEFNVIEVTMEGAQESRQFVTNLSTPHVLNRTNGDDTLVANRVLTEEALLQQHEREITDNLVAALQATTNPGFARLGTHWLPMELVTDVHVGHFNIAEALIEVQNEPLATAQILPHLDLPKEIAQPIALFSLDLGLARDPRFADVGIDRRQWYLKRLLPPEATEIPRRLRCHEDVYDRSLLTVGLLQIEWELDDEWTESGTTSVSVAHLPSVSVTITYPHRRSGTLPLTNRTSSLFPVRQGKHSLITFVDGRWGQRFPGWVVPEGRYICGLSEWYEEHKLPVGAYVVLERTDNPDEVVVDFRPRRMRREWVRMARVEGEHLMLQLQ